ncbi:hypothetical protein ACPCSE_29370 [Streptomyces cellulosae]
MQEKPTIAGADAMRDADTRPHGEFPRDGIPAPVMQKLIDQGFAVRRRIGEIYGGPLAKLPGTSVFLTDAGRAWLKEHG